MIVLQKGWPGLPLCGILKKISAVRGEEWRRGKDDNPMKIVFLDAKTLGNDLDDTPFRQLGTVVKYPFSAPEEISDRAADADVLVINKVSINRETLPSVGKVKLICVTATGTNILDKEYLAEHKIQWRNVAGYSTESVAQHTFAMLFYLLEHLRGYDDYVRDGRYVNDRAFTHFSQTFHELNGSTWGILGLGAIGRRVAGIAEAYGAKVIYASASGAPAQEGYTQVDVDTLLCRSDILSIHAPLNQYTEGLMNAEAFRKMKTEAILLNLGRGRILCEADLADALNAGEIQAAGLDVLAEEPMAENSPLLSVRDKSRLLITPHIAWAAVESRQRLMQIVAGQIREFFRIS